MLKSIVFTAILIFMTCFLCFSQEIGTTIAIDSTKIIVDTSNNKTKAALINTLKEIEQSSNRNFSQNTDKEIEGINLGLFIVDQTRTRHGSEFYNKFYQQVTLSNLDGDATIVVSEEPFRTRTTRLIVKINDTEIVKTLLRPNSGKFMENLVSLSVARVRYHITNYKDIQQSLDGEDMSGGGIF